METLLTTIDCASVDELAQIVVRPEANQFGIVVADSTRGPILDALCSLLCNSGSGVVRIPAISPLDGITAFLDESLVDLLKLPANAQPLPLTSEAWRDRLMTELREEQRAAQQRVAAAKQHGSAADPFERDVAGWLAAGLGDLFADQVTGESFLLPGKGAFARLAADSTAARFTENDFLRPEGIRFLEAGRPAQSMLTKLSLASTSQFRTAAARLMNQIIERLAAGEAKGEPRFARLAEALRARSETLWLLVENAEAVPDWLPVTPMGSPVRLIAADENETLLREVLSEEAVFIHYLEKPIAIPAPAIRPAIFDDLETLLADLQSTKSRVELFQQHGLLPAEFGESVALQELVTEVIPLLASTSPAPNEVPLWQLLDRGQGELARSQQTLREAWQHWFAEQLAGIDAEWFLRQEPDRDFLDVTQYMDAVREILLHPDARIPLPANEADFAAVEKLIATLYEIDRKWRTWPWTPVEEGMAFDAAVAAGGAPLVMLTEGVRWWLKEENRDWHKYRIVRVD